MSKMNPVQYAESVLRVHEVYAEAQSHVAALEGTTAAVAKSMQQLRSLREQLADRENVIAMDLRVSNPDASATALEKLHKSAVQADADHTELRDTLRTVQADHDLLEAKVDTEKRQIDVLVGRLHELGGLLAFYAEAKRAEAMAAVERAATPVAPVTGDESNKE